MDLNRQQRRALGIKGSKPPERKTVRLLVEGNRVIIQMFGEVSGIGAEAEVSWRASLKMSLMFIRAAWRAWRNG